VADSIALEKTNKKNLPLYEQIRRRLRESIESSSYKPGERLPAISALVKALDVDARTIRSALAHLEEEGLITYTPRRGAVVTRATTKKNAIAAVWAAQPDYRIIHMREGIRRYAKENNLEFRIFMSPQGHEQTLDILCNIEKCGVDGVIVIPFNTPEYLVTIEKLTAAKFPIVSVRTIEELAISSVETDSFGSGYQATSFLIDKYHQPAYLLTPPLDEANSRDRHAGFTKAMTDAGYSRDVIESHTCWIDVDISDPNYWPLDKNWLPAFHRAKKLLEDVKTPINVVCTNDYIAKGVYEAAAERQRTIGQDVRVVGIDDLPLAKLLDPPLTTVNSPKEEVGYEAARVLHGLIRDHSHPVLHVHLPVELIVRKSA